LKELVRGVIEETIDEELSERKLEYTLNIFKKYEELGYIKSVESAVFGKIYGEALNNLINYKIFNRDPLSLQELQEFERIIDRRVLDIWSKIKHLTAR